MNRLKNKVAVITGGTSGIGYATAQEFIDEGATVIITGRFQNTVDEAVQKLGVNAKGIVSDASKMVDVLKLVENVKSISPNIDILFLNAGISAFAPIEHITEEHYGSVFDTNVKGVVFTAQQLIPLLNSGGSIVITSTAGVHKGFPGASIYVASKAALNGFVIIWAKELLDRNIRVNSVSPGFTDTPLFDKVGLSEEQKKGAMDLYSSNVLMKRFANAQEIAKGVTFLASDESSYMNGVDLLIDGGYKIL